MADPIIECERCHRKYQVSAQHAGKAIRCRNCDHVIPIPRVSERRPFVAHKAVPVVDAEIVEDEDASAGTETVEEHVAACHTSGLSSRERRRERTSRVLQSAAADEQSAVRLKHLVVGVCSAVTTVAVILGIQILMGQSGHNDQNIAAADSGTVPTPERKAEDSGSGVSNANPVGATAAPGQTPGSIPPGIPVLGQSVTPGNPVAAAPAASVPQPVQPVKPAAGSNVADSRASKPAMPAGQRQRFGKSNYSIELPADFVLENVAEEEGLFTATWRSSNMSLDRNARLTFTLRFDQTIVAGSRPPLYNRGGIFPGGEMYIIGGSTIETLNLGTSEFHKLTYPKEADAQSIKWIMMRHFDGVRVKLEGQSAGPIPDQQLLEIASTFSSSDTNFKQPTGPVATGFGNATVASSSRAAKSGDASGNSDAGNLASGAGEGFGANADAEPEWGGSGGGRVLQIGSPPGVSPPLAFSGTSPQFAVNHRKVLNLLTGDLVAELPPELLEGTSAISTDGKRVAHCGSRDVAVIYVYSCEKPDEPPVRIENSEGTWSVGLMRFLDANRLVIYANEWIVFDTTTGRKLKSMEGSSPSGGGFALGDNGKYMAVSDHRTVIVYDTIRGRVVAKMASVHNGRQLDLFSCSGLAFSPDMKELVGLFSRGEFVVWSNKGEVLLNELLSDGNSMHDGTFAVSCLPDNSGWFLEGSRLLDRKSMTVVWEIDKGPFDDDYAAVMDQNTVMTHANDSLVFLSIPWERIRAAQAAQDPSAKPLLNKGGSMSVEINMGQVRFADPTQTRAAMLEAIRKGLEARQISIADNQPVKLVVNYAEEDDGQKKVRSSGSVTEVADTAINVAVELRINGQAEPLWNDRIHSSTGIIVHSELTPQAFRNENFDSAINFLGSLNFPSRISSDGNRTLPIRTKL